MSIFQGRFPFPALDKYSSVSSAIERMKALVARDRKVRDRIEKLILLLSKSQEQT